MYVRLRICLEIFFCKSISEMKKKTDYFLNKYFLSFLNLILNFFK